MKRFCGWDLEYKFKIRIIKLSNVRPISTSLFYVWYDSLRDSTNTVSQNIWNTINSRVLLPKSAEKYVNLTFIVKIWYYLHRSIQELCCNLSCLFGSELGQIQLYQIWTYQIGIGGNLFCFMTKIFKYLDVSETLLWSHW